MTRFAATCDAAGVNGLGGVDRPLIERYLADLAAEWSGRQRHNDHIGQLNSFLHAVRQHHWDDSLPAGALIFADDYPKRFERSPRALAETVMAQIERPENLDRWNDPAFRLVTLILIRAGLRVSDALRLQRDCVVTDAAGAPYLRYVNHKMRREALVPIDEEPTPSSASAPPRSASRRGCSRGQPRTPTVASRSPPPPIAVRFTAGSTAATSPMHTASPST